MTIRAQGQGHPIAEVLEWLRERGIAHVVGVHREAGRIRYTLQGRLTPFPHGGRIVRHILELPLESATMDSEAIEGVLRAFWQLPILPTPTRDPDK